MIDHNDFFEAVIQTHIEIEQWFSGVAPEGTLDTLLARFSPAFTMIAPATGTRVNAFGLKALFTRLGGQRPGLKITLSELESLGENLVTYREYQVDASGTRTDRRATAVFERQTDGRVLWRHLHETYCQA